MRRFERPAGPSGQVGIRRFDGTEVSLSPAQGLIFAITMGADGLSIQHAQSGFGVR